MPATYESIASTTLASANTTISFGSIPSTYTDLRVILYLPTVATSGSAVQMQLNSGSINFGQLWMYWNPVAGGAVSGFTNETYSRFSGNTGVPDTSNASLGIADIFNYTNTTTFKPVLFQWGGAGAGTGSGNIAYSAATWLSTAAVTSINIIYSSNMGVGTQATLYGIKKA